MDIATKEDVEAFRQSCVSLRSQWVHFTTLFEGSDLKRELLQTTAPTFFGDLNQLFLEHLVLHICRLTDEAQTMGRKNLTVKFLMEHTDWSTAPSTLAKLKAISESIHNFRKRILPARKWLSPTSILRRYGSTSRLVQRRARSGNNFGSTYRTSSN
jgi:hypothetical protein